MSQQTWLHQSLADDIKVAVQRDHFERCLTPVILHIYWQFYSPLMQSEGTVVLPINEIVLQPVSHGTM